jgi:dienelactone hydrolase
MTAMRGLHLDTAGGVAFAHLHEPAVAGRDTAVLLLPPFGWVDMCSYRVRRDWAQALAAEGHPVLRLDLPGSGDAAGGPWDEGLADRWSAAIADAARWLRARSGARRVAAVGPGFGGLLALRALAAGAPLDELALWGVPARGRAVVRELRAFARMTAQADGALPDGALAVNGYGLSAETAAALSAFDAGEAGPGLARVRRALLLERDGLAVDERLREALERAGATVEVAPGPGWAEMTVEPQYTRVPQVVVAQVGAWLAAAGTARAGGDPPAPAPADDAPVAGRLPAVLDALDLADGDAAVRETPLALAHPFGRVEGVLAEPLGETSELCAVLLNAGSQRRTGPNRMWVELARRWAAAGIPTARVDLAGIGDAGGDAEALREPAAYYAPGYVAQVRTLLDALGERGLPRRVLLVGLCAGATWSLHTALEDERVAAVGLLNPRELVWDDWVSTARRLHDLPRLALQASTWRRVLRGEINLSAHLGTLKGLLRRALQLLGGLPRRLRRRGGDRGAAAMPAAGHPVEELLDRLSDRGQHGLLLFTGDEPLRRELAGAGWFERLGSWPNLRVEIRGDDTDTHTLQPLGLQREVHALLDALLADERARAAGTAGATGEGATAGRAGAASDDAAAAGAPPPAGAPARTAQPS